MDDDDECDNGAVVDRQGANQRDGREVLEGLGQVLNPGTIRIQVDDAAQDAVDAEGEDQRRRAHDADAPTIDEADDDANDDGDDDCDHERLPVAQERADDGGDEAEVRADGNVDLTNEQDEGHSNCNKRVDDGRVEARGDVGRVQEHRVHEADDGKQRDEEDQAGELARLEKLLYLLHRLHLFPLVAIRTGLFDLAV